MTDFAVARRTMVDNQLRTFDITDQAVLAAMLTVARERFVPASAVGIAYLDTEIAVSATRRLLTPMVFAKLLQTAELTPACHVLDVGCATGYSTAVIGQLCAGVIGLEQDPDLARAAKQRLGDMGTTNVTVAEGPLTAGWPAAGPYDAIVINGLCEEVPTTLLDQLGENGRLVAVVGSGPASKACVYRRHEGSVSVRPVFDAAAPPLPGFAKHPAFQF